MPLMNKDQIKPQLESYLSSIGINPAKPFKCLSGTHPDNHPSMSYDKKRCRAHCFACGADYDIFDVIALEYGYSDIKHAFAKARELYELPAAQAHAHTQKKKEPDLPQYLAQCRSRANESDYLFKRGISKETEHRFGTGYDPDFVTDNGAWKAVIIPTGEYTFMARNTDPDADKKNRIRKRGGSPLFNTAALRQSEKPVFVVEGEIDAMSIAEAGGEAVGLGSLANADKFLRHLEEFPPECFLIIALDGDESGKKASAQLAAGLAARGVGFAETTDIYGACKDANELLVRDRAALEAAVANAGGYAAGQGGREKEEYLKTSVVNYIKDFTGRVAESVNTPCIPTGFGELDGALDGGLYEGLYIIGAISSLGKTTLALQAADQIAAGGTDVLIFSLEMARSELMAKSISRHTLTYVMDNKADMKNAKTARGITAGRRYESYSPLEHEIIRQAIREYSAYAGNVYIFEGMGDIGAEQIRASVERHIKITGRTPVIFVDYIQILAPKSEYASDKQNTDKSVLELKRMSRDFKLPVVGISSFNRQSYREAVTMEAFKESGGIEYSSDVLIGLQLEGAGKKDFDPNAAKEKNPRSIELRVLKNRNGATGRVVRFAYYPMFGYFKEG